MEPRIDLSPLATPHNMALLSVYQRHILEAFYTETPANSETSHHQTTSGIFVTIHQEYSAERSTDPDYHAVATCRRLGTAMLREAYDIHAIRFTPVLDNGHHSLEKNISLTSRETDRDALIQLGKRSLWVERDHEGFTAHHLLLPFDPKQLAAPTKE